MAGTSQAIQQAVDKRSPLRLVEVHLRSRRSRSFQACHSCAHSCHRAKGERREGQRVGKGGRGGRCSSDALIPRAARPSRSVASSSGKRDSGKKAGAKGKGTGKGKKVKIVFTTEYACADGEKLLLVGEHKVLGAWNPLEGVSLRNAAEGGRDDVWQTSVLLEKGHSYQFKFLTITHGKHIRWQEGSNRVINIPREVPSHCGFGAHVPWEGITSVTSSDEEGSANTKTELETLELLSSLQEAVTDPKQALYLTSAINKELLISEEDTILEANSKAVSSTAKIKMFNSLLFQNMANISSVFKLDRNLTE